MSALKSPFGLDSSVSDWAEDSGGHSYSVDVTIEQIELSPRLQNVLEYHSGLGKRMNSRPPFHFAYGWNVEVGKVNFLMNLVVYHVRYRYNSFVFAILVVSLGNG